MAKANRSVGRSRSTAARFTATAVALAGVTAMVALTACAEPSGTSASGTASTDPSSDSGLAGNAASASAGSGPGDGTGNGNSGGTGSPKPTTSRTPSTPAGPSIAHFKITKQPACPDANTVVLTWKVAGGATGAALSVDNPEIVGSYRTYTGTEGSETLTFPCDGDPGATVTHKYTLRTVGGGAAKRMDISASAKMPE